MFEEFEKSDKEKWLEKATTDLKGQNPLEKFKWSVDNIELAPYYDQSDLKTSDSLFSNRSFVENDPSGDPRIWKNLQRIKVSSSKKANTAVLEALNSGADGIELQFDESSKINFDELLNEVMMDYCYISFINIPFESAKELINRLNAHQPIEKLQGGLSLSGGQQNERLFDLMQLGSSFKEFHFIELEVNEHDSPSMQISSLLSQANSIIRSLIIRGISVERATKSISMSLDTGTAFFETIAKIKALRQLFYQVVRAYGNNSFLPEDLHIKCVSKAWNDELYQPHANMLKGSTAGLAAILGGCDSLLILPEKEDESVSSRIALNVSTVLKEEAYLAKVADPAAGSYYIEHLTEEIAKSSWSQFQSQVDQSYEA